MFYKISTVRRKAEVFISLGFELSQSFADKMDNPERHSAGDRFSISQLSLGATALPAWPRLRSFAGKVSFGGCP